MSYKVNTPFHVERDGQEIELSIEGSYSPGTPGKTFGPPENCYPSEPAEAEIELISFDGQPWTGELTSEENEAAVEALLAAGEDQDFMDGPDPDDAYDSRFDREDY